MSVFGNVSLCALQCLLKILQTGGGDGLEPVSTFKYGHRVTNKKIVYKLYVVRQKFLS